MRGFSQKTLISLSSGENWGLAYGFHLMLLALSQAMLPERQVDVLLIAGLVPQSICMGRHLHSIMEGTTCRGPQALKRVSTALIYAEMKTVLCSKSEAAC